VAVRVRGRVARPFAAKQVQQRRSDAGKPTDHFRPDRLEPVVERVHQLEGGDAIHAPVSRPGGVAAQRLAGATVLVK
jgi:hypothetical protein